MSKWIKKGDRVVVTSGNSKGQIGEVLARGGTKVLVKGANVRKKHARRRTQEEKSQIIEIERPISVWKVRLCTKDGKAVKIRARSTEEGRKELYYLDGGKEVVHRVLREAKSK